VRCLLLGLKSRKIWSLVFLGHLEERIKLRVCVVDVVTRIGRGCLKAVKNWLSVVHDHWAAEDTLVIICCFRVLSGWRCLLMRLKLRKNLFAPRLFAGLRSVEVIRQDLMRLVRNGFVLVHFSVFEARVPQEPRLAFGHLGICAQSLHQNCVEVVWV
jgi:hypothetical protein